MPNFIKKESDPIPPMPASGPLAEMATIFEQYFRELGFTAVPKPEGAMPRMPRDLASMGMIQVSETMSEYTAWREYSEDLLVPATLRLTALTEEYDQAYQEAFILADGKVTERKQMAEADAKTLAAHKKLVEAKMYYDMILGKIESFGNCIASLSREIAARTRG